MLTKMGWEKGKGLGKEGQGRAIPVEAFVRKGKAAVGMYGAESKDVLERNLRKYKQGEEQEDEEEEENDVHVSQWKKDKKVNKRPQYAHRTPQELLELAANNPQKLKRAEQMLDFPSESRKELSSVIAATKIKVIDMTGKEQRVMHGYESLSMLTRQKETLGSGIERKNFDLPELAYNLDLLVNLTEDQILQSDRKLKHNEDMIVSLSYEEKRSREKVRVEQEQIDKIKNLLGVIDKCEQLVKEDNVTLNDLIDIFQDLQTNYADEFLIFNLSQVAIPLLVPLLNKRMSRWNPFDEENKEIME
jgi:tuftelin-interacting protein 11